MMKEQVKLSWVDGKRRPTNQPTMNSFMHEILCDPISSPEVRSQKNFYPCAMCKYTSSHSQLQLISYTFLLMHIAKKE